MTCQETVISGKGGSAGRTPVESVRRGNSDLCVCVCVCVCVCGCVCVLGGGGGEIGDNAARSSLKSGLGNKDLCRGTEQQHLH